MKNNLNKILNRQSLTYDESKEVIYHLLEKNINEAQLTGILIGLQFKGLQLEEIKGFRDALLELATPIDLDGENAIDLCGTGGDGKNTFNISTTSAFVMAGMGYKVIKHGNYGVSSICGSSNVLEALGVNLTGDESILKKSLADNNICFLHAPLFHPVLKNVGQLRKDIGVRTVFNALGPLVNPAQPQQQLTGTYSMELATIYNHLLQNKRAGYRIVYGVDGYDELTFTGKSRVLGNKSDQYLGANDFNLDAINANHLNGGNTIASAKTILLDILNGKGSQFQNEVVAGNVALGLQCFHQDEHLNNLFDEALKVIQSGVIAKQFKFN